ncbi:L-fucose:H+ symporter permease [Parapedobacter sp. ISTM3]|uniref:L-fucose:H+ symporter permease n=1 Tax=Parapedobacter sp. ISTM3 TaxID=2800130 RepID=UPI0019037761|nr:L-fucose:H+ symporter permease [Parapedobacter sp. ISTM3]MBK1441737.1 L-fucose:H+ symporter permease [Parapedobacter sp. ISTM3]
MGNLLSKSGSQELPANQTSKLTERKYWLVFGFVTLLFLLWGIAITMGDVLNKHFQNVLGVSRAESGLVQFSIFGAYAVMGIPAGLFMKRFGYKSGVLLGLALYAAGAFLFVPAADAESFTFFRVALFILACGLATLETVAHPFIASLGDQASSDRRINFAQSFNGLGTIIGPTLGSYFILSGNIGEAGSLTSVKMLYVGIGVVIVLVAIMFSLLRIPALPFEGGNVHGTAQETAPMPAKKGLFQHRHFIWAFVAQFFNAAAQGGTWAFFINYGHEKMGLSDELAGYYFATSMVMMTIGRFVGTFLMKYIAPNKLLAAFAACNIVMCLIIAQSWGWPSFIALLMLNFFFSIMFPTIFSLGLKNLGPHTQQASSFIVMGVVGAAVFPFFMGRVADYDVAVAYYLPIICYFVIFLFGAKFYKTST